jgi:surface protein
MKTITSIMDNATLRLAVSEYLSNAVVAEMKYGPIGSLDVSRVSDMRHLFYYALEFNADLSQWDVGYVSDMSYMFEGATRFNADLSRWDVSSVSNMGYMFCGATRFNSDLSRWNVGLVTNMIIMFCHATQFNSDLSGWNVGRVIDMSGMFLGATRFNSDLSRWNVGLVTNMRHMFSHATSFNSDISGWPLYSTCCVVSQVWTEIPMPEHIKGQLLAQEGLCPVLLTTIEKKAVYCLVCKYLFCCEVKDLWIRDVGTCPHCRSSWRSNTYYNIIELEAVPRT